MVTQPTLSHLWVRCRGHDPGGVWEHSQVKCHGQGGLNERPLEGRVKVPARTRGTHSSAREMGPVSKSEEDGANATLSITGYLTGKCRDYG